MSNQPVVREASHAGSWYTASRSQLDSQLEGWLAQVKTPVKCIGPVSDGQAVTDLPVPGARMIIGPYVAYIDCDGRSSLRRSIGTLDTLTLVQPLPGRISHGTFRKRK